MRNAKQQVRFDGRDQRKRLKPEETIGWGCACARVRRKELPLTFRRIANVVTIEVAPGRRDQVVTLLAAHKARLKDEPGTLQFEVLQEIVAAIAAM